MKALVLCVFVLTCMSCSIANSLQLNGKLSAVFADGGDLVTRTFDLPADVRVDMRYPGSAASSVQSATTTGKDRHSFESSSVYYEAIMKNSSITFLRRDEDTIKMVFAMRVEYPEGCTASYLQPGFRDTSLFVALEGCVPLRIKLYDTSFPSEQIFLGLLQGKKVIVLAGHDAYGTEEVFYAYVNDASNVEFLSFSNGETWALPATDIGSCSVITDLYSLSTSTNTSTLDVIVDCLDSARNKLRHLVYVVYNEGIDRDHVLAVNKVDGEPQASEDGAFLAIQEQNGDVYSLFIYEVANILNTPAAANYMAPFTMKFLQSEGLTTLVILKESEDIKKIDVHSFTSSNGQQGEESIPGATVTSCVQCTAVEIIAGDILMMSIWNMDTLFYDLLYVELESDSLTPSRIPQVSSEPLLFSFVGFPVEPSTTETESSSTDTRTAQSAQTTTNSPGAGEQSEPPTTSEEESPTSHPQPLTHPGAIVGWVVLFILVCLVGTVLLVYVYHRRTTTPTKYSQEEEGGDITPEAATSSDGGQIVTPTFPGPKPMQETVPADDGGYITSTSSANSSSPSTPSPTPQDTPLPHHRE